jgi:hypothetical protein
MQNLFHLAAMEDPTIIHYLEGVKLSNLPVIEDFPLLQKQGSLPFGELSVYF